MIARLIRSPLFLALTTTLALLLLLAAASVVRDVPIDQWTRDPTAVADLHPLTGVLSNIGVLLWSGTAVTCGFAYWVRPKGELASLLRASAFFTAFLLFDDLFLFHEFLAQQYFGVPQEAVLLGIALLFLSYLIWFGRIILTTDFSAFVVALVCFACSLLGDELFDEWLAQLGAWAYLLEDGAKLLGIVAWLIYYVGLSYRHIKPHVST